ncbi:glycosyltransferase family 39 protein [Agrobacterium sp. a22-2]|uniref:glycosyltransferase family 39 protein n=1 Tax=Agrobacterium sp. a22-2 TaxID=2283840 RepID=UPI001447A8FE|nr:glycosyltransferase family 39 protein [Agrobacterium sp. a22-2]NKN39042.1 glycosyltransferase family 39 protein [Agrobacterium sp. a22-2]
MFAFKSQVSDHSTKTFRAAALVIIAGTLFRILLASVIDPGVDEAYAIAVGTQWQLSWFDHPPMAFWWVKAMREIARPFFGQDVPVLVLRLPFVIAFTMTSVVMFSLTSRLWGPRAGLWMVLALTLAPFFSVSAGSWVVPDGPLLLFLSLTAWLMERILFSRDAPERERCLWLAAGLTLGLAGLSKYHAAIFAMGAALFIIGTPHRRHLTRPAPWLAVLIAGMVASPVFIWNVQHDWVAFVFQSSRGVGSDGPDWSGFARSVFGQAAYLGPWTLVGALAASSLVLRASAIRCGPAGFLAALGLPTILLFTAVPLWGGDALPHWQMPGWLFLLPILGHSIATLEAWRHSAARAARSFAFAAGAVLAVGILAVLVIRYTPPSQAETARLGLNAFLEESVTWRGLADNLIERGLLPSSTTVTTPPERPLVVAFNWVDASRLAEALGARASVRVFGGDPRGFAFLADHAAWTGRDVLIIGRPDVFDRGLRTVRPLFTRIDRQAPVAVEIGGETLFDAQVAIGRNLISFYPLPYPRR